MGQREQLRDEILRYIPVALLLLQRLEMVLEMCCALLQLKGINVTRSDLLSPDANRRGPTLGKMLAALKDTFDFAPDFKDHLSQFVAERNWLVHHVFIESGRNGIPNEEAVQRIHTRLMFLLGDTQNITDTFLGLYRKIGRQLYEMSDRDEKQDTSLLEALGSFESLFDQKLNKMNT